VIREERVPNETVDTLLHATDARACVAAGARPWFAVRDHEQIDELFEVLRALDTALVVIDATDARDRSMAPSIAAIRHIFPALPILAYCSVPSGQSSVVVDVVRAGATGLIFRGIDDARYAMRAAIAGARRGSVGQRIHDEVALHLPAFALPLLHYAITRAADDPSVEDAATSLGVDRKTLLNWLRQAGGVGPREFINWIRLAAVAGMLEEGGRTAEQVALASGFASGASFRNMLQRYTGLTSSQVRTEGGMTRVLAGLIAALSTEAESDAAPRKPMAYTDMSVFAQRRRA
jgi:AraC-like DNA-binding protein